ncbi:MAG: FliA/WhiG family RNA polymerase sigma factor [candidate division FCPU426 bacterium]
MQAEERRDWDAYQKQGDRQAHARLCERYLPDVRRLVGRMAIYLGDGVLDREDLIQAGVIGLIQAIDLYDPEQSVPFIDYARKRIRGAVYDELRALDGYSSRSRRQQQSLERIRNVLQQKLLRMPSEEEIAEEMGVSLDQLHQLQASLPAIHTEPLDADHAEELGVQHGPGKIRNWIPGADGWSMAEKFQFVAQRIETLPERAQIVLGLYYRDGLTLREIAEVLDLTEARICQIHSAALEVLEQQLQDLSGAFVSELTK